MSFCRPTFTLLSWTLISSYFTASCGSAGKLAQCANLLMRPLAKLLHLCSFLLICLSNTHRRSLKHASTACCAPYKDHATIQWLKHPYILRTCFPQLTAPSHVENLVEVDEAQEALRGHVDILAHACEAGWTRKKNTKKKSTHTETTAWPPAPPNRIGSHRPQWLRLRLSLRLSRCDPVASPHLAASTTRGRTHARQNACLPGHAGSTSRTSLV